MPDDNTQTTTNPIPVPDPAPVSDTPTPAIPAPVVDDPVPAVPAPSTDAPSSDMDDTVVVPDGPLADALQAAQGAEPDAMITEVASKIAEAQNILIALSSDPSVDELSAAIGLSLYLDKLGKRATAIYSGATPNALEFLKPEDTFEDSADTLQDFVIALNKDKADHLRYKLDGDYVKVYITPYKSRIAEDDLEFSYGDFNIDLVLALDVANGIDLDAALREHGRIMHDAVIINITTGIPGKLGEIEWSDKNASSVSEMIAKLLYGIKSDVAIDKEEATAFLTGIVAATNSFSNASTTPETMKVSAKLMESGADQQLIAKNITPETENEIMSYATVGPKKKVDDGDPTKLEIEHEGEEIEESEEPKESEPEASTEEEPAVEELTETSEEAPVEEPKEDSMMDDLKAAEASLSTAGDVATPVAAASPIRLEDEAKNEGGTPELPQVSLPEPSAPVANTPAPAISEPPEYPEANGEEMVIEPSADFSTEASEGENKYGQMLEDALAESGNAPAVPTTPIINPPEDPMASAPVPPEYANANPAASFAPPVPTAPEINGIPEMDYMPMPDNGTLPPPPTPPVDFNAPAPNMDAPAMPPMPAPEAPAAPAPEVPSPVAMGGQPAMQDQVYNEQAANPGAFKIPGM
jgi:hypothetical protein